MLNKSFLVYLTILLLFAGCNSPKPKDENLDEKLPLWISNPINSDETYIYGAAIEKNRELAIKSALNDMVSKLGIYIQSTFTSDEKIKYDISNMVTTNKIKTDVTKIKIDNYEIVDSKLIGYKEFAILLRTNKVKFADSLSRDIKTAKKGFEDKIKELDDKGVFYRYKLLKNLLGELEPFENKVSVLHSLDKGFEDKKYIKLIEDIKNRFEKEKNSLNFFVVGDKNSARFVEVIKQHLISKNFNVSAKREKDSIIVQLRTIKDISKNSSLDIAVLTLIVDIFERSNHIGGKYRVLKERYIGSDESLYKNASIKLESIIKPLKLTDSIGLELD